MFKEYKRASDKGRFSVDLDKVAMVSRGSKGNAIIFLDGDSDGIEIAMDYDTFMETEMGVE